MTQRCARTCIRQGTRTRAARRESLLACFSSVHSFPTPKFFPSHFVLHPRENPAGSHNHLHTVCCQDRKQRLSLQSWHYLVLHVPCPRSMQACEGFRNRWRLLVARQWSCCGIMCMSRLTRASVVRLWVGRMARFRPTDVLTYPQRALSAQQ